MNGNTQGKQDVKRIQLQMILTRPCEYRRSGFVNSELVFYSEKRGFDKPATWYYKERHTPVPITRLLPRFLEQWRSEFQERITCAKQNSSIHQLRQVSVAQVYRADLARKLAEMHSHADDEDCSEVEWKRVKEAMLSSFKTVLFKQSDSTMNRRDQ
ncbi:hypothetical protein T265_11246 [Opisthorchis viverrini]|uniref:Uncharacterized protein n=1 Tax=Opisthorchis viverrini TaxID=6198 RepID=A0A074ZAA4_OPIVI|nr:hypothetical protein T265_11246 [Opisthorchis viverrini]KER20145.1 hypothetical protein T265_11246 [Opisthorchis viverrini]